MAWSGDIPKAKNQQELTPSQDLLSSFDGSFASQAGSFRGGAIHSEKVRSGPSPGTIFNYDYCQYVTNMLVLHLC